MNAIQNKLKRFFDFFVSIVVLYITAPLLIILSIAIKVTSRGPVFFKQERLGKNGQIFNIIKFRTMVDNAINIGSGLSTFEGDPRVTRVGIFLRKTSLDELPQLFNIIKGDMSIVGPRPPVPHHPRKYNEYPEHQIKRFSVKPGVTGYAQVKGRNSLTWDERIEYDVKYVIKQSILMDFIIIMLTIIKVLKTDDIHGPERRKKRK